ncbi:MAG TPA: hypothetical protein VM778_05355 [Gemmatimonadota bacterium]|nr:hypothetical protein [Gemmatimonadota bacterium]
MSHGSILLLALLPLGAAPAAAQILDTPAGPVEFVGLEHRTPEAVRDALAAARPDVPIHTTGAAQALREALGFADAAAGTFVGFGLPDGYMTLTVVEPEEAARVRYAEPPPDSLGPIPEWSEAYALFPEARWAWGYAVFGAASAPNAPDETSLPAVRAFLDAHATPADRARAMEVLASDRHWFNRSIAAAVLSNFPDWDETWHALARAARGFGPDDRSRGLAVASLTALGQRHARPVDWTPAADDLRALLDGTSVFAFPQVLEVLARTRVSRDLAGPLLAGGGELVLDHLSISIPSTRARAMGVLEGLSGLDYGSDAERWRAWIETL